MTLPTDGEPGNGASTHTDTDTLDLVRRLNAAWTDGDYEALARCFDPDVIMCVPGQVTPIRGVKAMVESYRAFGATGTLHQFDITDIEVFKRDSVEICHFDYRVDYEIDGSRFAERGRDVYVIATGRRGRKTVVWRTQLPLCDDTTPGVKTDAL